MEEFIAFIQYRSTMPYGQLLFSISYGVITFWSAVVLIASLLLTKPFGRISVVSSSILTICVCYGFAWHWYSNNLELTPSFNEAEVVGVWQDQDSRVQLNADGSAELQFEQTYLDRLKVRNGKGYWYRDGDFNLIVGSSIDKASMDGGSSEPLAGSYALFRVISYADEFRIIIEDFEDVDSWDGHLGFQLVEAFSYPQSSQLSLTLGAIFCSECQRATFHR